MENLRIVHLHNHFKEKELGYLYISKVLSTFGAALISVFIPIYLFQLGYKIHSIILFYFLISLYFVIFSQTGARIVSKIGAKHSMILSIPFTIVYYISLNYVDKFQFMFFLIPLFGALNLIFYWYGYHSLFFNNSNRKKRGREISIIYILTFTSVAVAPFIGGFFAEEAFYLLFIAGSFTVLMSAIPLLMTKDNNIPQRFTFKDLCCDFISKKEKKDIVSFSGYAIESSLQVIIWPIFLITILGTYLKTGSLVSITIFTSLLSFYVAGRLSDKYDKIKLIKTMSILHAIGWITRIFATTSAKIFFIDTYKRSMERASYITWESQIYKLMDKRDYFRFLVFEHLIFHGVRVIALPIIAVIFYYNYYPFTISFIIAGISSLFMMKINRK